MLHWASQVAQTADNLHPMWETRVQSLGWEDPLEWGNDSPLQYSCLENSIDRDRGTCLSCIGSQRVGHDLATKPLPPSYLFVICPAVIGHLGYFFVLAIVNSAINIEDIGLFFKYDFLKIYAL